MMVCQPRQERSGTWWREPKMGLGIAGHTSEPNPLSAGIPRRPFPAFPHAKIWLSAITQNRGQSFSSWEEIYATNTDVKSETCTDCCHRWTTGLYVLTLSGCNGEAISTWHLGHYFPSKGSDKDLDTLVFFEVLHAQLAILVATKGDQTTTFCKVRRNSLIEMVMTLPYRGEISASLCRSTINSSRVGLPWSDDVDLEPWQLLCQGQSGNVRDTLVTLVWCTEKENK